MEELNCSLGEGKYITLKDTNLRFNEIYALLLSSAMADKTVRLRIEENSDDCELNYAMLNL